ncbi:ABC transporter ATP-binding protein [Thiospirillum jenense]|uniref:ABC transporter ATP-binding protein n=2 Tax=Thiospirillum jenense TaxID=1653858 RepID=A0A839HGF3_9GAMM|nr:ABC transporter ATP-binding protein [Thiospirillum jenense]MBB1126366.1 ABC transporter ATP-binding protein [Thiospirillum jenense]
MSTPPALHAIDVSIIYGQGDTAVRALDTVNLQIGAGEIVAMMGPSGSGKTTLLMVLGGLLQPTLGEVQIRGQSLTGLSETQRARLRLTLMGFIFQSYNLFPALTALENVQLALELKRRPSREAAPLLEQVGLGHRRHSYPAKLSGGEKQRVAIARALAGDPGILLADEPTAALDTKHGMAVVELLRTIAHEQGRAIVMVTHDPRVGPMSDRLVTIADGKLVAAPVQYGLKSDAREHA